MADIEKKAEKRAAKLSNTWRNHIITEMAGAKTGREYKVPGTNRTYTASAPDEYPAIRTGALRSSIGASVQFGLGGVYAIVGTNTNYAVYLEGGLRPFIIRASRDLENDFLKILSEPWF